MHHRSLTFVLIAIALTTFSAQVDAHYLWVVVDPQSDQKVANIYFEELPKAGDGHYLDHFLGSSKVWIRTIEQPSPDPITATEISKDKERWMQAALPKTSEFSVDSYGKFGVYAYGKTKVLLHYYAKNLVVSSHDAVHELGPAEQMDLDLVPHSFGSKLDLTLRWKGHPVGGRMVFVRGPKGFRKNIRTDDKGSIELDSLAPGKYSFRSSVEENVAGTEGDEKYELVRHNITLICQFPLHD